jgi:hypothetical protein
MLRLEGRELPAGVSARKKFGKYKSKETTWNT